MCARHTITSEKYVVFPTRSLHTYPWSLTYSSTVKDIFRSRNRHGKPGKTPGMMMLLSLLEGCKTIKSCQNGMKRLQGFVLTVQTMMTCTYHLNPPAAISVYGWRCQARHLIIYCTCAMDGLPCLFCLRAGTIFSFTNKTTSPLLV